MKSTRLCVDLSEIPNGIAKVCYCVKPLVARTHVCVRACVRACVYFVAFQKCVWMECVFEVLAIYFLAWV